MISMYRQGNSLLHRMRSGWKLGVFAVLACVSFFVPVSWWSVAAFAVFPVVVHLLAGFGLGLLCKDLLRLLPILVFLVVTQLIFLDLVDAATNTVRVIALVLAAQTITRTTRMDSIVETVEKLFSPLARFGVAPEKIGLAVSLVLTSVGHLIGTIQQVRDAQKSRGVRLAPWSWLVPVLVLTLKHSDDVADALLARGWTD